jgi:hypothetical protein
MRIALRRPRWPRWLRWSALPRWLRSLRWLPLFRQAEKFWMRYTRRFNGQRGWHEPTSTDISLKLGQFGALIFVTSFSGASLALNPCFLEVGLEVGRLALSPMVSQSQRTFAETSYQREGEPLGTTFQIPASLGEALAWPKRLSGLSPAQGPGNRQPTMLQFVCAWALSVQTVIRPLWRRLSDRENWVSLCQVWRSYDKRLCNHEAFLST